MTVWIWLSPHAGWVGKHRWFRELAIEHAYWPLLKSIRSFRGRPHWSCLEHTSPFCNALDSSKLRLQAVFWHLKSSFKNSQQSLADELTFTSFVAALCDNLWQTLKAWAHLCEYLTWWISLHITVRLQLVYLTAESPNVLEDLDKSKVRWRRELNIDVTVQSADVLDHCVLLRHAYMNTGRWTDRYTHTVHLYRIENTNTSFIQISDTEHACWAYT